MKRGDIFFANLDPTIGSEMKKTRPVLLVSNNIANQHSSLVTIVSITSNIEKIYPFEVFLDKNISNLNKDGKVCGQQIRTISKKRLIGQKVGTLNSEILETVDRSIRLHLGL